MTYNNFEKILNNKIFGEAYTKLLLSIADNHERFLGIYRPSSPKIKLIQNMTQSREIKFGDALEQVFSEYFNAIGYEIMARNITDGDDELDIDQLLKDNDNNIIYLIEQKVRDDHDSTKKRGQFVNFKKKFNAVKLAHGAEYTVIPIMWFIDPSLHKNKTYYEDCMEEMVNNDQSCTPHLLYGKELSQVIDGFNEVSDEVERYLERWKATVTNSIDLNFDQNSNFIFEELRKSFETKGKFTANTLIKILKNEQIKSKILPILFPNGSLLRKIKNYFLSKTGDDSELKTYWKNRYNEAVQYIDSYIEDNHLN